MHPSIARHRETIEALCRRYHVRRLEVFGSAARGEDFDPDHSDADFLVEFEPQAVSTLAEFFEFRDDLSKLLGRPVDLVEAGTIRNPYVLETIDRSRETVYGA